MLLLLLQSLSSWLQLKVIRAHWELSRDIESYCELMENGILAARQRGDDALADRMRARLARASGIIVPAIGDSTPSKGPDVPSAGR